MFDSRQIIDKQIDMQKITVLLYSVHYTTIQASAEKIEIIN